MPTEPKALDAITKDEFKRYERVRKSGRTNMFSRDVEVYARIDEATHVGIMHHYGALCAKWPDIRNLGTQATEVQGS